MAQSSATRGNVITNVPAGNAGRGLIPDRTDISERPAIVARKTRLGDWEGDTVVSAGHKGGLLTLVERKTQLAMSRRVRPPAQHRRQPCVASSLSATSCAHHHLRQRERTCGASGYRPCTENQNLLRHAVSRMERGLNENTNGLIRDFFPKGTDFSTISSAEVAKVERLLNARPRKSLGFRSPQEVFHSLASLKFSMRWEVGYSAFQLFQSASRPSKKVGYSGSAEPDSCRNGTELAGEMSTFPRFQLLRDLLPSARIALTKPRG